MKRKISNQISVPVIIVSALAIMLIVIVSDILINRIIDEQIDIQIDNASENFYGNLNRLANRTAQVSTALSINPDIISTFKEFNETNDYEASVERLESVMERLTITMKYAGFGNLRFQFHTKDIRSL
jgi:lipoprotein NlpI